MALIEDVADAVAGAPGLDPDLLRLAKRHGFSDAQIAVLRGMPEAVVRGVRHALGVRPVYKTVDTCAAEFAAQTPYHYSTYDEEDEVAPRERPAVLILGSGPNRIGQGVEFDYSCVHASLRPARRRLRHGHGQLQPRDGLDRLRHEQPPVLRAAHPRGRPRGGARREQGRPDRRRHRPARRADAARPGQGAQGRGRADRRHLPGGHRPRRGPRGVRPGARRGRAARAQARHRLQRRTRRSTSPTRSATRCSSARPTCSAGAAWRSSTTTRR